MKKISFLLSVCLGSILFTSCLGDGGHVIEYGSQAAVAQIEDEDIFLYITNNKKLSPNTNLNLGTGECVLIDYKIDLDEAYQTVEGKGEYSPVTLVSQPEVLKKWTLKEYEAADTASLLPSERTISTFRQRASFLKNNLFLFTDFAISDSLVFENVFDIGYFKQQEPKTDTVLYKDKNVQYLELFLRAQKNGEGKQTLEKTQAGRNAFYIGEFVETFRSHAEQDTLYVRIKYAKTFNSDSTSINWGESQTIKLGLN